LVQALVGDEQLSATINPSNVEIFRDRPPLGSLLAMAWASEFDTQPHALLLSGLPWEFLQSMHKAGLKIGGQKVRSLLEELYEKIQEREVEIEDLLPIEEPASISLPSIRAAFRKSIASALRRRHADEIEASKKRRDLERRLAPYKDQIQTIYDNYSKIRAPRRYPGGGRLPPDGLRQLKRYLTDFVSANGCMPSGVHTIPAGQDIFDLTSNAFDLDFDAMGMELPFILDSGWDAGRKLWFWKSPSTLARSDSFDSESAAIVAWKQGTITLHKPD
jgi:hypothetical protein